MDHSKNSKIMKILLYVFFATAFVLILSTLLLAQPGLPTAPSQAPIDGGLTILAVAGGGYALKKLRNRGKEDIE